MRATERHLGECQAPVAVARRLGLGRDELRALIEELHGGSGGRHGN